MATAGSASIANRKGLMLAPFWIVWVAGGGVCARELDRAIAPTEPVPTPDDTVSPRAPDKESNAERPVVAPQTERSSAAAALMVGKRADLSRAAARANQASNPMGTLAHCDGMGMGAMQ